MALAAVTDLVRFISRDNADSCTAPPCSAAHGGAVSTQLAAHRGRIAADPWSTEAWDALYAEAAKAASQAPSTETLALQRGVLEELLAHFPHAVR